MSDTAMYRQQSQMGSASAVEKVRQATADHYSNGIESCSGIDQWVRGHEIHGAEKHPHHGQCTQQQQRGISLCVWLTFFTPSAPCVLALRRSLKIK
jgi:hypothetical protein